jgi:type IV pilus biogenesis protein CpaD/CtpE
MVVAVNLATIFVGCASGDPGETITAAHATATRAPPRMSLFENIRPPDIDGG